jgi:hypothetical protein
VGREIIGSQNSQQIPKQIPKPIEAPEVQKQVSIKLTPDSLIINALPLTLV